MTVFDCGEASEWIRQKRNDDFAVTIPHGPPQRDAITIAAVHSSRTKKSVHDLLFTLPRCPAEQTVLSERGRNHELVVFEQAIPWNLALVPQTQT